MKRNGIITLIIGMCLVLTVTFFISGTAPVQAATTLKVGTGPVGGNWFPLGAVVATIINENIPELRAAPTLGGGGTNLKALNRGTQDLSLTIATTNAAAWEGKPPFEKKYRDARSVFNTYINAIHAYTPQYTGITKVEDLKGKKVSAGKKGYTQEAVWGLILKEYGIEDQRSFFGRVEYLGYAEAANLMKDKHLDCYMIGTLPPSAPFLEVDTFTPVTVFTCSPEVQKKMIDKYPGITYTTIPGGIYKGLPNDLKTIGYPCVFACRKGLPEDMVYQITKAFWEHHQDTWKVNPNFKPQVKPENAIAGLALPLHPGAYKYYKEKGYDIPDKIKPID
jgi:TRAP transporter TAXI family solute receptor